MANYRALQQLIQSAVNQAAGKTALRCGDRELSYAELDQRISMVAAGLRELGVTKGDRVAWYLSNCIQAVLVTMACYRLGAIAVPLNYRSGGSGKRTG